MIVAPRISDFITKHVLQPFADKPGVGLPGNVAKEMTVAEMADGRLTLDRFIKQAGQPAVNARTGATLDMVPRVSGGFQAGDIVLRGNSLVTTAESGVVTTLADGLTKDEWQIQKSAVSHAGIVARNAQGELRIIQMVSGETPTELLPRLTSMQKRLGGTFLRNDSIPDFFNSKGEPFTDAVVMRPKDPQAAEQAARRALAYYDTQVTPTATHPWFSKLPHSWAPDGRGGVCSTFVDLAYSEKFKLPDHLPTTPEQFVLSPDLERVGERRITDIRAVGQASGEGTLRAGK